MNNAEFRCVRVIFALAILTLISAAPPNPSNARAPTQFSLFDLKDAARRRRALATLHNDEVTSAESSMLLPITGIGHTDFANSRYHSQQQQHNAGDADPVLKSHFSWDASSVASEEHPPETQTRKSSIASIPSMSTHSTSSISSSFPFPDMSRPRFSSVEEEADENTNNDGGQRDERMTHSFSTSPKDLRSVGSTTSMAHPLFVQHRPPALAQDAAGQRIPGSHYRVLSSGDFYCEHCGYVFQNCHKVC